MSALHWMQPILAPMLKWSNTKIVTICKYRDKNYVNDFFLGNWKYKLNWTKKESVCVWSMHPLKYKRCRFARRGKGHLRRWGARKNPIAELEGSSVFIFVLCFSIIVGSPLGLWTNNRCRSPFGGYGPWIAHILRLACLWSCSPHRLKWAS